MAKSFVGKKSGGASADGNIDVYVKLTSGRALTYILSSTDTIETVCGKVASEEGVSSERVVLKYTGKVLKRPFTLGYLGVRAETILKAEIIQVKKWTVLIKTESGKCFPVQVDNISPVRSIAVQVEAEQGIAIKRQVLKLDGHRIPDLTQKVMDVGIKDESVLELDEESPTTAKLPDTPSDSGTPTETDLSEEDKQHVLTSFDANGRNIEVVFCFDTTGSMYSCLTEVRQNLRETVTRLIHEIPTIRIGVMAHGDYCDYSKYVEKHIDLTTDVDELVNFVDNVESTGGGDSPECYEWALKKAQQLDWSEDSAKAFVMIGDCEPHPPSYTDQNIWWKDEVDVLAGMQVKVYGVRAMNSVCNAPFYEEIAERTGGAYLSFTNFRIITEMFLAVCYREASGEQYDQYRQEVLEREDAEAGGASGQDEQQDVKEMLRQLDEQAATPPERRPSRYVASAWWDRQLDHDRDPLYCYNQQTDTWSSYSRTRPTSEPIRSISLARTGSKTVRSSVRVSNKKRKCSIM